MQSRYQVEFNIKTGGCDVIDTHTFEAVCHKATAALAWDAARAMNIRYHNALQSYPLKAGGAQKDYQRLPLRAAIFPIKSYFSSRLNINHGT